MGASDGFSASFMPHGMCYLWQPGILILHIVSDALITLSYFSIPFALLYFVRRRTDLQYIWMFACFAIFIVACGVTHLMEIWTIWRPDYWVSGGIKAATASVSLVTAALLVKIIPRALELPSPSALQRMNADMARAAAERIQVQVKLEQLNAELEQRVAARTTELRALNESLAASNERFSIAADAAGLGFWTYDLDAGSIQWDGRMFALYGRPQVSGPLPYRYWAGCVHPDDREAAERAVTTATTSLRQLNSEFRIVQSNGAVRHLRSTARVTRIPGTHSAVMLGVDTDVTAVKLADQKFRLAIDAAPTGMLLVASTGAIVLANAAIEKIFGYVRTELLGRQVEALIPERFRGNHPEFRHHFVRAPTVKRMGAGRELFGMRRDGTEVPIEIGLNPIRKSDGEFVLCSIVDLSERLEVDKMRSDFVSTVSHELRTPLTSISGALRLLDSGAVGPLPEQAGEMVHLAYENCQRLVKITNDILDFGKLEAGELNVKLVATALPETVRRSIASNAEFANKCGVRFVLESSPQELFVVADPDRLMQILANLLSNAAKFSPTGSDVIVRIRPGPKSARVEVEDCGPGIPEEFKSRIFQKFVQLDSSSTRRFDGTGLGLSIARKLVEAMGGQIGFETTPGKGSTFHFDLTRANV